MKVTNILKVKVSAIEVLVSQNILDVRAELRRREARFIAVKQIKDVKEQIQELKGERVWAEVIENEKVCD